MRRPVIITVCVLIGVISTILVISYADFLAEDRANLSNSYNMNYFESFNDTIDSKRSLRPRTNSYFTFNKRRVFFFYQEEGYSNKVYWDVYRFVIEGKTLVKKKSKSNIVDYINTNGTMSVEYEIDSTGRLFNGKKHITLK